MKEKHARLFYLRKFINRVRKEFHDTITDYKFFKTCIILLSGGYFGLIVLGIIIAFIFGGQTAPPGTYHIWTNYISDLGGIAFTPAPYLYDLAAILCGVLSIPFWFYLETLLVPLPQKPEEYNKITRLRYRLGSYGILFSSIGSIGYVGIGFFSIDRDYMNFMHLFSGALAFGGFILGALFYSGIIVLYNTRIPKILGLYGIFGPFLVVGFTILVFLNFPVLLCLFEWLVLFSIIIWMMAVAMVIILDENLHL